MNRVGAHQVVSDELRSRFRQDGLWGDATLLDWWAHAVLTRPDCLAVADNENVELTYAQVDRYADRLAAWMSAQGVERGAVVSVQLPNWAEFLIVLIAICKNACVINPLSITLREREICHAIETCQSQLLVLPDRFKKTDFRERATCISGKFPSIRHVLHVSKIAGRSRDCADPDVSPDSFHHILASTESSTPVAQDSVDPARPEDLLAILFTSGTESEPKGVMLSHNNLLASELGFIDSLRLNQQDRMLMPAPLGHATGFLHGVVMPILSRSAGILSSSTCGEDLVRLAERYSATIAMAVPSVVDEIVRFWELHGVKMRSLRSLCCGGAPVPKSLLERAKIQGVRLYSVYGSTESAPHTLTGPSDSDERVLNTDGRPCFGTEIRVVDPATREILPPGLEGEEASRGPAVFMGYLGDAAATERVLDQDGWYYSGDLCVMDPEGYIRITGRKKDLIIRGGENISAAEVEKVLMDHPHIREAAVVAMPDPTLGERACAFLVAEDDCPKMTIADLYDYFELLGVAKFKIPERVEYLVSMPRTSSGKVAKVRLRAIVARERLTAER